MGVEEYLRHRPTRKVTEVFSRLIVKLLYSVSAKGVENLNLPKPFIIAPNHCRNADGFAVNLFVDTDFALAKEECWLNPYFKIIVPGSGGIPVVRKEKLEHLSKVYPAVFDKYIKDDRFDYSRYIPSEFRYQILDDIASKLPHLVGGDCAKSVLNEENLDGVIIAEYVLRCKRSLMVFPQGTRSSDTNGAKFGLAKILYDLAFHYSEFVPVIPCGIRYDDSSLRQLVQLSFGKPMTIELYLHLAHKEAVENFMLDWLKVIHQLSSAFQDGY